MRLSDKGPAPASNRPSPGSGTPPTRLGTSGRSAGLLFGLFAIAPALAAEPEPPSEVDFFRPIPPVSMATRLPANVLDTPASVTVIDRALIQASPATNIPELLRLVPGFQVTMATGAQYSVTRHGLSDQLERRLEVLVNGNSVYLATNASVDWNLIGVALEDIDRIEVVRSPNAPALGSNAMFGSINIITRKPFELAGGHLRGTGGSVDTAIGVARIGGRLGPMDSVATFQYRRNDGFDQIDDHTQIGNLRLQGDVDLTPTSTLDIEIMYSDGDTGADGAGTPTNPFRDYKVRDSYQAVTWRELSPDGGGYRLALTHRVTKQDDSYRFYPYGDVYVTLGFLDATSERFDLEFEHTLKPMDDWRLLWGVGARYDEIDSDLYFSRYDGERSGWSGRVLAAAEWRPLDSLLLSANALTEFYDYADTYTSPRLGVNWRFLPTQALRASVSRNYRALPLGEQYGDYPVVLSDGTFVRDLVRSTGPRLAPEQLTSYELGYLADLPGYGLSLDLTLFREDMNGDRIGPRDPTRAAVWSDNGRGWTTKGVEAQLRFTPDEETLLFGSYAYALTDGERVTQIDDQGRAIAAESLSNATPRHTLAVQLSRELHPGWQATLALFYMSEMRWLGEGGTVDAYTRLDAKVSKAIQWGNTEVELALIAQNLMNDAYDEFRPEYFYDKPANVFDRRIYLQISANFPGLFR